MLNEGHKYELIIQLGEKEIFTTYADGDLGPEIRGDGVKWDLKNASVLNRTRSSNEAINNCVYFYEGSNQNHIDEMIHRAEGAAAILVLQEPSFQPTLPVLVIAEEVFIRSLLEMSHPFTIRIRNMTLKQDKVDGVEDGIESEEGSDDARQEGREINPQPSDNGRELEKDKVDADDLDVATERPDTLKAVGETDWGLLDMDSFEVIDAVDVLRSMDNVDARELGFAIERPAHVGMETSNVALEASKVDPCGTLEEVAFGAAEEVGCRALEEVRPEAFDEVGFEASEEIGLGAAEDVGLGGLKEVGLGSSQEVGLGSSQEVGLGTADAVGLGTTEAVGLGTTEAVGLGTAEAVGLGTTEADGLGASEEVGLGTAEADGLGASEEVGLGASQEVGLGTAEADGLGASEEGRCEASGEVGLGTSVEREDVGLKEEVERQEATNEEVEILTTRNEGKLEAAKEVELVATDEEVELGAPHGALKGAAQGVGHDSEEGGPRATTESALEATEEDAFGTTSEVELGPTEVGLRTTEQARLGATGEVGRGATKEALGATQGVVGPNHAVPGVDDIVDSQYREFIEFLRLHKAQIARKNSIRWQGFCAGGSAMVGGFLFGPVGGLLGGVAGSLVGYIQAENYDGVIQQITKLNIKDKAQLVDEVLKVLYENLKIAGELFITAAIFRSALDALVEHHPAVLDEVWRLAIKFSTR